MSRPALTALAVLTLGASVSAQEVRRAVPVGEPEVRRAEPVAPEAPAGELTETPAEPLTPRAVPRPQPFLDTVREPEVRRAMPVAPEPTATPVPVATPVPGVRSKPSELDSATDTIPAPAGAPDTGAATTNAEPKPKPTPKPTPTPLPTPEIVTPPPATPVPGAVSTDAGQILLEYANGLYARKLYDMAAPEYERYLSSYVNGNERQAALFRLAECHRAQGNFNAAANAYDRLLGSYVTGDFVGPAAFRLADIYMERKEYATALPLFRKAIVRVKDRSVAMAARFYSARCLENLGQSIEARVVYEEIIAIKEENPYREASRIAAANLWTKSGRASEALKQYEALAKETDKPALRAESLVRAGLLRIELREPGKAAADLKAALEMPEVEPWRDVARLGLLRILYESGKYKDLVAQYEAAPDGFSAESLAEVTLLAANSYRQVGQHAKAVELYERIVAANPGTVFAREARYQRLASLYAAKDPRVVAEADAYLANDPDPLQRDQVQLLKAEALYRSQDYAGAAKAYASVDTRALTGTLQAEALFKLGWCYSQTNAPELAIRAYTDFLERFPTNKLVPTALAQRAAAYQQTKDFEKALKDFSSLIAKYPRTKERELALQQKALILGQQQENAAMAETFRQLLRDYPKSRAAAQANYWIGWVAFENKDYKNAPAPLEAARKLDKEQFFERATLRIMLSHYYLEQKKELAAEVELYLKQGTGKVPGEVLRWLGAAYLADKNFTAAETFLAALTSREDVALDDWLNLARGQTGADHAEAALKSIGVYLESAKDPYPRATGLLVKAEAQLKLGEFDSAKASAEQACTLQPEGRLNAEGRSLLGEIAMRRGNFDEAAKIFMSVSVVFDDPVITPRALERAAEAFAKAGDPAQSAKVINTLQSRYPEYPLKSTSTP